MIEAAKALPSAGWYEDPRSHDRLRWWDGAHWSEHTAEHPEQHAPAAIIAHPATVPSEADRIAAPAPGQVVDAAPPKSSAEVAHWMAVTDAAAGRAGWREHPPVFTELGRSGIDWHAPAIVQVTVPASAMPAPKRSARRALPWAIAGVSVLGMGVLAVLLAR